MKSAVLALLGRVLRRLAKLALEQGITVQEAIQLLKTSFVLEAKGELSRIDVKPSVSKVSAMTGLHRREVDNLFNVPEDTQIVESNSLMSRIIGLWLANKRYRSSNGSPKSLPLDGKSASFISLVQEISKDLNAYTILFELERLKLITREGDLVSLQREGFEPRGDATRGIALLSSDIEQLISAVTKNISAGNNPPNLHITTSYDNIDPGSLKVINEWIQEQGARFHRDLRELLSKYDRDLNPKLSKTGKSAKVVVGSFSNSEEAS